MIKQMIIFWKTGRRKRRKNSDLKLVPVGGWLALLVLAHSNFAKKTSPPPFKLQQQHTPMYRLKMANNQPT
jgi:hypothetical protein